MAADKTTQAVRSVIGAAADRLGITPSAVGAGVLAALAAGLGGWWALRAPDPPPVETVIPSVFEAPIPTAGPAPSTSLRQVMLVDVGGAVVNPGVHELQPGDRVIDAVKAAGGLTEDADRRRLNLAMPVDDGQRIWVPVMGEDEPALVKPEGGPAGSSAASSARAVGPININRAESDVLQTLPGIGPSLAASIIAYRTREGPFAGIDDLTKVPGIGRAKMQQLAPLVKV